MMTVEFLTYLDVTPRLLSIGINSMENINNCSIKINLRRIPPYLKEIETDVSFSSNL